MISCKCSVCGLPLSISEDQASGMARCPACGTTIAVADKDTVPAQASEQGAQSPAAADPYAPVPPSATRDTPGSADPSATGVPGHLAEISGQARKVVSGYEVLGELGRGGMGVVYKARQVTLNRTVALKMILSGDFAGSEEKARFRREAEAIARLQHPGIVSIVKVGEHQGLPFFSLEFCPGGSLDDWLRGTPMQPSEAAALGQKLAEAMQAAH